LELQTQLQFAANTFWFGSPPEDANQSISPNQLFLCFRQLNFEQINREEIVLYVPKDRMSV
jgi:hypothetical protein